MRTRVLLAVLSLALTSCEGSDNLPLETAADRPELRSVSLRVPLDETFSFVTSNPCNGEDVLVTGHVKGHLHLAGPAEEAEEGLFVHSAFQLLASGTGVGLSTGAKYLYRDHIHDSFNSPSGPATHGSVGTTQTFRMISQGNEPNFRLKIGFRAVFLPPDARFELRTERMGEECTG